MARKFRIITPGQAFALYIARRYGRAAKRKRKEKPDGR